MVLELRSLTFVVSSNMKKCLVFAFALWASLAQAQFNGCAKGFCNTGGSGAGPTVLLLDSLTAPAQFAYSTRKLRSAYAGNALRVQRTIDSTQSDIGFTGNNLNTTTLASFCLGTDCVIVTWYDQMGNTNAATGNVNAAPRIVIGNVIQTLNSNPTLNYSNGVTGVGLFISATLAQPNTIAIAQKTNAVVINAFLTDGNSTGRQLMYVSATTYQSYGGAGGLSGGTTDLNPHGLITSYNGASSNFYLDGASLASGNNGTDPLQNQLIGYSNGTNAQINGLIPEYIVFPSAITAPDIAKIKASWAAQWGTP